MLLRESKKLTDLKLRTQELKISNSIAKISNLKKLDLEGDGLTKVSEKLFELKNLTELN